jgi:hypothetical protein
MIGRLPAGNPTGTCIPVLTGVAGFTGTDPRAEARHDFATRDQISSRTAVSPPTARGPIRFGSCIFYEYPKNPPFPQQ